MIELPWDKVPQELRDLGYIVGQEEQGRLPIDGMGFMEHTNLPARSTCPNGISLIVLRPSLQALYIDERSFLSACGLDDPSLD